MKPQPRSYKIALACIAAAFWLDAAAAQVPAQTCPALLQPQLPCACTDAFVQCNDLPPGPAGSDDAVEINRCLQEPACKCVRLRAATTYGLKTPINVKSMRGASPPVILDGARLLGQGAGTRLKVTGNPCGFPSDPNDGTGAAYAPVIEVNRTENVTLDNFTLDVRDLRQQCPGQMRKGNYAIRYVTGVSRAKVTRVRIEGEPFGSGYQTGGGTTGGILIFGAADSIVQANSVRNVGFLAENGSSGVSAIQLVNSARGCIASNQITNVAFGIEVVNGFTTSPSAAGDGSNTTVTGNTILGAAGIASCPACSGGRAIKLQACREGSGGTPPPLRDLQVTSNNATKFGGGRKSDGSLSPGGSGIDLICGVQFGRFVNNTINGQGSAAEFGLQLRSACEEGCNPPLVYTPAVTTHHNTFEGNTFFSGSGGTGCGSSCADVNINAEAPDQINIGRSLSSNNTFRNAPRQDGGARQCPGSLFSQVTLSPRKAAPTTKIQLSTRGVRPNTTVTVHFLRDGVDVPFTFQNVACTTSVSKRVSRLGLTPGTYMVTADYQDGNAGSGSDKRQPVTIEGDWLGMLTVLAGAPVPPPTGSLAVSPSSVSFMGSQGGPNPGPMTLAVTSTGGVLEWTAFEGVPWLSIAPAAGTTPGSASVAVNLAGLAAGTYTTQILVSSPDASDLTVPVTLTVGPPGAGGCTLAGSPSSLTFSAPQGGPNAPSQLLSITSPGGAVSFTLSESSSFLSLSPASGVTPGTATVTTNVAGLAPGTYMTSIQATCPASPSGVAIGVTLTVTPAPPVSAPFVSGFQPVSGSPGAQVEVVGGNFSGVTGVTIAGQPASFSVTADNRLFATVPSTLPACGPIRVTNTAGTGQSPDVFAVTPASGGPVICSVSPQSGRAGDGITIRGANFVNVQSVTFSGVGAAFGVAGPNFLSTTVPGLATTGRIQVTTASGTATSPADFVVSGGSGGGSPSLTVSPASLAFQATQGGANPPSQSLLIGSTLAPVTWIVSDDAPWLTLSPSTGTTGSPATVSVNIAGLSTGSYSATIQVTSFSATPASVPVSLTVTASGGGGGGGGGGELIANGGFEGGLAPWTASGDALYRNGDGQARAGSGYVLLEPSEFTSGTLTQTLSIPAGTGPVSLTFFLRVDSTLIGSIVRDRLQAVVVSPTGQILRSLATFSNVNRGGGYVQRGPYDLSAWRGQTVRLEFRSLGLTGSGGTQFRVDDVSVK